MKKGKMLPQITLASVVPAAFLLTILPAAGGAGCDFPYYPEFADRIGQYDEVTPLMAKKFVMVGPSVDFERGSIVCEPLLIKTMVGMPLCYIVGVYRGDDVGVVQELNNIIKEINSGAQIPADRLYEDLIPLYGEDFSSTSVETYTFQDGGLISTGGFPAALVYYPEAVAKATEIFGTNDIYFNRIIGAGWAYFQIFEFENKAGETVAIETGYGGRAYLADLEEHKAVTRDGVRNWVASIDAVPDKVARNVQWWERLNKEIPDEMAAEEFPRITGPLPAEPDRISPTSFE